MTIQHSSLSCALALAASVLAACGGGSTSVGIDGTGNDPEIVSYGRLRSVGSVEINGVHYDTASTTFQIDGSAGSEADIGLGDILFVEGRLESGAGRGVAQKVTTDRVLQGQIAALDAGGSLLQALGQIVLVDQETQFTSSIVGGLSSLQVGDAVNVSGFRNAQGAIVATRIARQTGSTVALKTTGAVTSIDTATRLLTIDGLVVDYSAATMLPSDAAGQLATGVFVEVKLAAQDASGAFTATSVEIRRQRVQGKVGSRADMEGYITRADAASTSAFDVDGLPVVATGSTTFSGTVSADKRVMVSGSLNAAGVVVATSFNGTNRAPVAANASVSTQEETELIGALPAATDPDGDAVSYGVYDWPRHGVLEVSENGGYRYRPTLNFSGSDSFVYRVFDNRGGVNSYTVTVTVSSVDNDAPILQDRPLAISFGEGAIVLGGGADGASSSALALQADDRILVTGVCDMCPTVYRFHADGTPDFAVNGTYPGANSYGVAVGADGKIVAVGAIGGRGRENYWDFALWRFHADGTLDLRIGTELSPAVDEAEELALMPDGRILVRGYRSLVNDGHVETDYPLLRYNPDGTLDTSFGGGDGIITPSGSFETLKGSFAALPDGRLLVAEPVTIGQPVALLRRYQADGVTPDAGFGGGDGAVELAFNATLALQPDGRVLLTGCNASGDVWLQRLNTDGSPDAGFGDGDGLVSVAIGASGSCGSRVVVQPDGRLLVAASSIAPYPGSRTSWLLRFLGDGTPDTRFGGGDGIVELSQDPGKTNPGPPHVAVQSDGRIVVMATRYFDGWWPHMYLMRLHPDGTQDLDFGTRRPLYEGQFFSRTLPAGTFVDPDGDVLTYEAVLTDGSPLPAWLHFDAVALTFSGTPPVGAPDLHVKITATDPGGKSVSDRFGLRVLPAP